MTQAVLIIIYIVFCVLAGLCGTNRRLGFFGTFLISLIITPVVMLLVLILTGPAPVERHRSSQNN
jgi:uncharacterized membrane protein